MDHRITTALGAAAAAVALVPAGAAAQAPTPSIDLQPGACVSGISSIPTTVQTIGYPANTVISAQPATGGGGGSVLVADPNVATPLELTISNAVAGEDSAFTNSSITFTPSTSSGLPPVTTPVTFINAPVVRKGPSTGSPRRTLTWSFAGFAQPGAPIYAHIRFGKRTVRNFRFGTAGPCGTLTKRAASLPVARSQLRTGTWRLQFDSSRTYKLDRTKPSYSSRVFYTRR